MSASSPAKMPVESLRLAIACSCPSLRRESAGTVDHRQLSIRASSRKGPCIRERAKDAVVQLRRGRTARQDSVELALEEAGVGSELGGAPARSGGFPTQLGAVIKWNR